MNRKRFLLVSGVILVVLLVASAIGATVAFAQEPTPTPEKPLLPFGGRGGWGFGGRGFFGFGGGRWALFDAAAEALGLSPEELFSELHQGKTLEEVAEEQGVGIEDVQEAIEAARAEAMREAIQQAVEDGTISQEQADWMLEGLEQGFFPMGRGLRHGLGRGRFCPPAGE